MAEQPKVGEPRWWLQKLEEKLNQRRSQLKLDDDYYEGNHPLPFVTRTHRAKMRDEFRGLLEDCRSNFCGLVVDAVEERLQIDGFRLSASRDRAADKVSWDIWQANQMDAESQVAITEALAKGRAYLSVWFQTGQGHPVIAVEDPLQTIVAYEPGSNFRRRAAALKVWQDEWTGEKRANVYLPDGIYKYRKATSSESTASADGRPWEVFDDEPFVMNPIQVVPIIPLRNKPRLLREGQAEHHEIEPTQDRINGELFMRALAGYFGAHRQRWAVNLTLHEDDQGNPIEPFDIAVDRLVTAEPNGPGEPEPKFGDFAATSLDGYIAAIEQDVLHIAVTTRTPRHYLIESGQSPSGDAIRSAEAGLIKKAARKQRTLGEGFEEAMRLARRFAGESDAPVDSEVQWADPETQVVGVWTDAVVKQFQAGLIPWEAALEKLGYTQTQIARFRGMRQSEEMLRRLISSEEPEGEGEEIEA